MPTGLPTRVLNPARRWALRELKIHPGQTVLVAGAPVTWTVELARELVTHTGTVILVERDPRLADHVTGRATQRGWINVHVRPSTLDSGAHAGRPDRVLLDDARLIGDPDAVTSILAPLRPAARLAAVCSGAATCSLTKTLEEHVHALRREPFYLGAAHALWGQLP